jgi:hypothetical protein
VFLQFDATLMSDELEMKLDGVLTIIEHGAIFPEEF